MVEITFLGGRFAAGSISTRGDGPGVAGHRSLGLDGRGQPGVVSLLPAVDRVIHLGTRCTCQLNPTKVLHADAWLMQPVHVMLWNLT